MVVWVAELSEYDINYVARNNIKSEVLADFLIELILTTPEEIPEQWILLVDGSSNLKGRGTRTVIEGPGALIL